MKCIFCIVWLLSLLHTPYFLIAQKKEPGDFIIELPLEIDEFSKKISIDKDKLRRIKQNRNRCKFFIINDFNAPKQKNTEIQQFFKNYDTKSLPFMAGITDTLAILIKDRRIHPEFKYLILVGLDEQLRLRYFYSIIEDEELNPCHNNLLFIDNEQFKSLRIKFRNQYYDFILLNPSYKEQTAGPSFFPKSKNKGRIQLTVSLGIPHGVSSLRYKPDTSQIISSIYYEAKIANGFAFKLQASYSFKKILSGVYLNYENYNFENNTRVIISRRQGGLINLNYSGNGNWPEQLLHFGVSVAYEFLIYDDFIFSPSFNASYYTLTGSPKHFDTNQNVGPEAGFKKKYSLGAGAKIKIPIYEQLWFSLEFIYQNNNFDARSYFTDVNPDSYHMRQEIYHFDFGICYNF